MEEKNEIMEHLRATLLRDIELQENVRGILRKMLKRYTIILATVSAVFLMLLGTILYLVKRPVSQTELVLRNMKELNESFLQQRKFIMEDRKDIAVAREQYMAQNQRDDSLKKIQDSILDKVLDLQYKKLMKKK